MGPLGRTRAGIRLTALLVLLDIVTQCRVFSVVTEDTGLPLEEETTAASSITENTEGKGQVSFRTTGSITNQSRLLEQLGTQQVTTYKPRVEAQAVLTREDNLSVSSKTEKEALNASTTLRHELATTPSSAVFMTTPLSATSSSPSVSAMDNGTTPALQDALGSPAPTNFTTSAISNTTPRAMSDGRGLLRGENEGMVDVTTSDSNSQRSQTETATTMQSQMPVSKDSETPTVLPGSEMPKVTTGSRRATVSDGTMDVGDSSSSETPATVTSPSSYSSSPGSTHWYIIAAVIVLATLILIFCFVWNVRRRRNSGSTSFQNPTKKNRKAGEDAWAGPVQMPEENCMPVDAVEDEHDPSGKRLMLTTFFNKRKSRQCSVVLEEVAAQPVKSTKDEVSPLLIPKANGQANGNASPTSGEHEPPPPPEVGSQTIAVQEPPPAQTANEEVLPPPPSPPPGTDFPAPPPSPEMQTSQTTV